MFNKLWLCHNINTFYRIFGETIGVKPAHTKLRDLNDTDFLLGVQFDIMKALEAYKYGFSEEDYAWLNKMYEQITTLRETPKHNHKPLLTATSITLAIAIALAIGISISRSYTTTEAEPIHNKYTAYGRYYTDGTVITNDGNEWGYSTDTVSDQTPYDNMPVCVSFDDNGTPNDITLVLYMTVKQLSMTTLKLHYPTNLNLNGMIISILEEVR